MMAPLFLGLMIFCVLWSSPLCDCLSLDPGLAFVLGGKDSNILCASSRKSLSCRKEAHTYTLVRQIGSFEIIIGHKWTMNYR